jgi:AcrR family transcriptional regulator
MRAGVPQRTRERILLAAEAFFGDAGYHGTSLHDIAARVGVQKASLFHYFPSKDELYGAVLEQGFGETEATIRRVLESDGPPLAKIGALVDAYVEMVALHPARTKILLRQSLGDAPPGHEPSESDHVLRPVVEYIAAGQRARAFARVDALALVLGVVGMVVFFFASAPMLSPEFAVDGAADMERIKAHVTLIAERALTFGTGARMASGEHVAV